MNNITLKNKLDKQLEQEYLTFFNITKPSEYSHFTAKENEERTEKFIKFFLDKKQSLKNKKHKNIEDYLLIKLCGEKIDCISQKLSVLRETHNHCLEKGINNVVLDFTEVNRRMNMIGKVPQINKLDQSLKNVWKTHKNTCQKYVVNF